MALCCALLEIRTSLQLIIGFNGFYYIRNILVCVGVGVARGQGWSVWYVWFIYLSTNK